MRIRKNSSKVLGSDSNHYWFMQPSSNSSENSIAELRPPSAPMKCELNLSPWDVLDFASEQLPDLVHQVNEDTKTSDLMETEKKAGEEEATFDLESGSSSLCASKTIRRRRRRRKKKKKNKNKNKKDEEEKKESSEGMKGDGQMAHPMAKRRNNGSRMKVASDYYYFSTAGSWWGRMRKGPKRSRLECCTNGEDETSSKPSESSPAKEKDAESTAKRVGVVHDFDLNF